MTERSPDDTRNAYRGERCHIMAIALSRVTGLPLGLIAGEQFDTGSPAATTVDYGHAVVIIDVDRAAWLDVDGLHVGLGAAAFRFGEGIDRVIMVPATEESVALAFGSRETFKPAVTAHGDLDAALQFIQGDPELRATLNQLDVTSRTAVVPDRSPP